MNACQKVACALLVARGEGAKVLETAEKALDQVALFVQFYRTRDSCGYGAVGSPSSCPRQQVPPALACPRHSPCPQSPPPTGWFLPGRQIHQGRWPALA